MKNAGIVALLIGIVWALVAFSMTTTVTSRAESFGSGAYEVKIPSQTVHNIGLMERRRNHLMFAGLTILVGVLLIGFGSLSASGSRTEGASTPPTESSSAQAPPNQFADSELVAAVLAGDIERCKQALEEGANPASGVHGGPSALKHARSRRDQRIIGLLEQVQIRGVKG
jgi:hypothetical protein